MLFEKGNEIWASMPYHIRTKMGFKLISMPTLTQNMGVYIKYPQDQKYYKRLSWEKEIMLYMIGNLPKFDHFMQNFNYTITNWLPFYWSGFKQNTNYTYRISNSALEYLEKKLTDARRRMIKKACKCGVKIINGESVNIFYELNLKTFDRQNKTISYNFDFVENLYNVCKKHDSVKMYFAQYSDKIIAANFLIFDENNVYYLMGGIDPQYKDLGAMDAILFESIKFALNSGRTFDFEGSMIESIEIYFRSFGAIQMPYFCISKTNSKILKFTKSIKEILD